MARGRKKRRINERTHVVREQRDTQKEKEFLNSEVNLNHLGEHGIDDLVRAIVFELPDADEVTAREIGLALQKHLRGDASIEANPDLNQVKQQIMEEAAEIDKAAEDFEKNRESFVNDVFAQAPQLTDAQREKLQAKGRQMMSRAIEETRAEQATSQLQFKQKCAEAPLVDVNVTGRFVRTKDRGMVQMPEVLRVMGLKYKLEPGVQKLPKPLAEIYQRKQRERILADQKKALLQGKGATFGFYDEQELARKLAEVHKQMS